MLVAGWIGSTFKGTWLRLASMSGGVELFCEGQAVDFCIVTHVHGKGGMEKEVVDIFGSGVGLREGAEFLAEGFLVGRGLGEEAFFGLDNDGRYLVAGFAKAN